MNPPIKTTTQATTIPIGKDRYHSQPLKKTKPKTVASPSIFQNIFIAYNIGKYLKVFLFFNEHYIDKN